MGVSKCRRDTEESLLPASKQLKIGDFYKVPTSNRYEMLADKDDDLAELFTQRTASSQDTGNKEIIIEEATEQMNSSHATENNNLKTNCGEFINVVQLIAITVEHICKQLNSLHNKLDCITKQFPNFKSAILEEEKLKSLSKTSPASCTSSTPPNSELLAAEHNEPILTVKEMRKSYQLVLIPNKICLTICNFKGSCPSWNTVQLTRKHLRTLFPGEMNQIDLLDVDSHYTKSQTQRVMLSFESSWIPQRLFQSKEFLASKGIFFVHVFKNEIISPLLPNMKYQNHQKSSLTTTKDGNDNLKTKGKMNTASQYHNLDEPLDTSAEYNILDDNFKEQLQILQTWEQQHILERLDLLRKNLLQNLNRNREEKVGALCDRTKISRTVLQTELDESQISCHSISLNHMPLIDLDSDAMTTDPVSLPSDIQPVNGCIFQDSQNLLDQIVELD